MTAGGRTGPRERVLAAAVTTVTTVTALTLLTAGCGSAGGTAGAGSSSSTPAPAQAATTASPTATPTTTATTPTTTAAAPAGGNGCPANATGVPAGAGTATTGDVDLDGQADTVWLADSTAASGALVRTLGIRTATGATFSTTYSSAAPQAAAAIGQKLATAGPAVVLLDTGRSVALYAVVDFRLVPTKNAQGQQYTFDLGFTGYGTGVACVRQADGTLQLTGLDAKALDDQGTSYRITSTAITLTDFGRQARNGRTTTTATKVSAQSPQFQAAHAVSCGDQTRGAGEPQS